jgi:enamine deaminase RidA (YjgF/YER057c/UK114 family)
MTALRPINPWKWQDQYGFSQAIEVTGAQRVLYCAGQTSNDADGHPLHVGDMTSQVLKALDNLETVLSAAGLKLENVVRLNYYTTDVEAFLAAAPQFGQRLQDANCKPAATLLKVAGLFHPDIMVELEATAVA